MTDLFECPELLPKNIQAILSRYADLENEKGVQYADLIEMGKEMAIYGYQFDFYLDCIPYNLQKINN
jgi:inorganic pyrophosphatase